MWLKHRHKLSFELSFYFLVRGILMFILFLLALTVGLLNEIRIQAMHESFYTNIKQ